MCPAGNSGRLDSKRFPLLDIGVKMATTVGEAFRQFSSNLTITDLQESTVSTRQQNIRTAVENGLTVLETFLTGSYRRHTLVAPLKDADIDILVVLNATYFNNYNGRNGGQAALLDLLKRTLRRTYTQTPDISRNGQAVTIRFTDFSADVVPGFYRNGGGYLIPNSITQTWISTDPKKHVELVAASNQWHNGDLVPLIRMLKAWNRSHSDFFRSFHLEVLALQILNNVRITDYPSGLRYFFDKARTLVAQQNPDPAGYGGDVGVYLDTQAKIQEATTRFQRAYEGALRAETQPSPWSAIASWRTLLGDYFPAYG
jgi:hypothetical protein